MSAFVLDTPGLEQGDIDSYMEYGRVQGPTGGFLSMVGALGLNWFIAFLPDYQLYQTLDFFADLLDELSLSDDDPDTEAAMSWFYTNSPLFGSWFVGKIGLLGW